MMRGRLDITLVCLASLILALMLVLFPVSAQAHQSNANGSDISSLDTDRIEQSIEKEDSNCHPIANCSLLVFVVPGSVDMAEGRPSSIPKEYAGIIFSESLAGFEPPPPR